MEDCRDERTYRIIGAAMEVHRELGSGFLEAVYREALAMEFAERGIPFEQEVELPLLYKGRSLKVKYRADFICFDRTVIVETKALTRLSGTEESQILNYLRAAQIRVGLLINFGETSLFFRRFKV